MEKLSRFRDDSTGIQVFLTPVPPVSSPTAATFLAVPVAWALGILRLALLLVTGLLWTALASTLGRLSSSLGSFIDAILGRLALLSLGFLSISTETVSLKARGRAASKRNDVQPFSPSKGDLILSNHSSWIDVLYLVSRFSPAFVLPVVSERVVEASEASSNRTTARRRNEKPPASNPPPTLEQMKRQAPPGVEMPRLIGWKRVGWLTAVSHAGRAPVVGRAGEDKGVTGLEAILKEADRPVVVFPELVTSNNRGLLKMGWPLFPSAWSSLYRATGALRMGPGQPQIFVMTIKHGPPSSLSPSTVSSIPSASFHPIPHALRLLFTLPIGRTLQVRLLNPSESPTSPSTAAQAQAGRLEDWVGETMSSVSRLRRTGLGWEDKEVFLDLCGL